MKSLTIRLPDDIAERLEQESRERGISKSDLVRERLSQGSPRQPAAHELMAILEASWADSARDRPRQFRSPHKRRLAEAIRAKKKLPR